MYLTLNVAENPQKGKLKKMVKVIAPEIPMAAPCYLHPITPTSHSE
jgi:hypothetical protein